MNGYPKPMTKHCLSKILDQMNNSLYKINEKDGKFETGFFCYVKIKEKTIPVLIINNSIQLDEYKDKINVSINNKSISIEVGETCYQNKDYNMTMIEIKNNKKYKIIFLEIDDGIYKNDSEMYYDKQPIYIIQWKNMQDTFLSFGIIKDMNKSHLIYSSEMESKTEFYLIFNLSNNKLIGKHESELRGYKHGKFFKILINKFINKYNADNKYNKLPNEINILIKVDEKDINKNIYFLDNQVYVDQKNMTHCHDNLKELNELNTKIYINERVSQFQKYFTPTETGEYNINLKIDINLTDCSYMFAGCTNILKIDFLSFNTKYVQYMKNMFHRCIYLKSINLYSFDTKNVIDMSNMFSFCENLNTLDLSFLNTKNVINVSNMFSFCKNLKYLNLPLLDYEKDINMDNILYGCELYNLAIPILDNEKIDNINIKYANINNELLKMKKSVNERKNLSSDKNSKESNRNLAEEKREKDIKK